MIVDPDGSPTTADKVARKLAVLFGDQLIAMGPNEWFYAVDAEKLTDRDESEIHRCIDKHLKRVRKFLRVN